MPLPEGDRSMMQAPGTLQFSFTRGTAPQRPPALVADAGDFARSLELLRSTSLHLSLYRLVLPGLSADEAFQVMDRAFGPCGMVSRLNDGSFALLLIGTDADGRSAVDAETGEALNRALSGLHVHSPFEIA